MIPEVSFLIATFNRRNFIQKCVDSVISQSVEGLEIVIIDDASTDGTAELIYQRYGDKVVYFKNDLNQGVAASRNTGLGLARGAHIGLLDSDDVILDSHYSERALETLKRDKNLALFCCDAYCIDENDNRITEKTFFQRTIDHKGLNLSSGIKGFDYVFLHGIHSCGAIVRRDIIDKTGFLNTDYKIAWDEDFFLRLSANLKDCIYYENEPMVGYRVHQGNISNNSSRLYREKIRCRKEILLAHPYLKKALGERAPKRFAEQYICLADAYSKEHNLISSINSAAHSVMIFPPILPKITGHGLNFLRKRLGLKR